MGSLAPALLSAQTQPAHPLDALTMQEHWPVFDVLQSSRKIDKVTSYATVLLHEPAKDKVLAWKPGEAIPGEADAILFRKGQAIEARVDTWQ